MISARNIKDAQFAAHDAGLSLTHTGMTAEVLKFMIAFDQFPTPIGTPIPEALLQLRKKLIVEEYEKEMMPALDKFMASQSLENLTEFVDGCIDSIYVILGALIQFNVPADRCFDEVQRSNMAKLNADGTYTKREDGKVLKPAHWTAPDLFSILAAHRDQAVWSGNIRVGDKS
jgi:hypothetical protein